MDRIDKLPAQLTKRNWIVLALLLIGSLPLGNKDLSLGILTGGLVAIAAFMWMRRSLSQLLAGSEGGGQFRYQFGYIGRLIVLAVVLAVLIAYVKIHVIGLIVGLSVVVINLFWMAAQQALK